jgi:benzoate/toluate 1,2-dioxygenase reductase component
VPSNAAIPPYTVHVTGRQWLTGDTFELRLTRPDGFDFRPGQKIGFADQGEGREYTLLNGPMEAELAVCVRLIPQGRFTPRLAAARIGEIFRISAATGRFTFEPSSRPPIFIATGTGIAPFVAFVRAGLRGFDLLHGVRSEAELYYRSELSVDARRYIPCISRGFEPEKNSLAFAGRVDACLEDRFTPDKYDFYLCGRTDMIRDVTRLIDRRFEGSFVFSEAFF